MKVIHVISGGDIGGAKTHVISLLKELKNRIDVDLVCFMEATFSEEAKKNGINTEVIVQKGRWDIGAVKKLADKIKTKKYDIIHCHGARANFIAILLKLFCSVPTVTTIHSDYRLDFQGDIFKNIVFKNINAFSLRFIDYYIGVSNSFKDMMIERGFPKDKVYSVYNGISFDEKISCINKEEFYKKYGIPYEKDSIYVGIMGRLHPVKGHEVFLDGAALAYKKNKDLRFLIAGDGEEEERLKEYARKLNIDHVTHFLGFMKNPYDFFNAIDINTLTSYSESFPYVILEGAIMKKPIISSRVGGIEDMIFNGDTGYVFEKGDFKSLGDRILSLAQSKEMRFKIGNNLYNFVKENFSTKNMADQHIKIYEKIIQNKR
ncbi:glycosyltransferase [Crassaminicella thermophila]|uniref:Glycosyltransferase n=1 Tax=Crassaminicella thermophila TaxID=2599308 RepID=A0A5C0SEP2_CRATE|nr:glycosyltransferase [Crassaminicella thermophila]QEK11449.1 glycosyltransferase [Crassaminicella thermophila]